MFRDRSKAELAIMAALILAGALVAWIVGTVF